MLDWVKSRQTLRIWRVAVGVLLPLTVSAAENKDWRPPRNVGLRVALASASPLPWCDFAANAQAMANVPLQEDGLFRTPDPNAKAKLGQLRKILMNGSEGERRDAEAQLAALFAQPAGASLARLAAQDADAHVQAAALRAAKFLAAKHPRLYGYATAATQNADAAVAQAALIGLMATQCDAGALYALDGLQHPTEIVQMTAIELLATAAIARRDLGLYGKLAQWLETRAGSPNSRRMATRLLGHIGWLPATETLRRLLSDADNQVAAEALVALATVAPDDVMATIKLWLRDKLPVKRAAAVQAIAQALAMQQMTALDLLKPLLNDRAPVPGLPQDPPTTVAELAKKAIAYVRLER